MQLLEGQAVTVLGNSVVISGKWFFFAQRRNGGVGILVCVFISRKGAKIAK